MAGFLNPTETLKKLNLREDMIAADFGCGSGGWVIPLAKILNKGKVFAIDIQEEMLSALKSKTEIEKLFNIEFKRANLDQGSGLRENSLDLILMTNLLFQTAQKKGILADAKNILKPEGRLLIIDWNKDAKLGPQEERVSPEEIKEMAGSLDFITEQEFDASDYHWGLILKK
jgi:ubiquinone/menaquinone biosynthesis C-methylase UbiE